MRLGLGEHRCEACGYLIDGLPEPRCPECGGAFDPELLLTPVGPPAPLPWLTCGLAVAGTTLVFTPFLLGGVLGASSVRWAVVPYAVGLGLNLTVLWRFGAAFRVRQRPLAWWLLAFAACSACLRLTCGGFCGAYGVVMGGLTVRAE